MPNIEIIGLLAATCTTAAFIPQVYKAWKYRSTADISLVMYLILLVGLVLWLIYGIYLGSIAIILANTITGVLVLTMLFLKIRHK
ncbi:MAG: SemiSWEET transporter [Bacteroidota bacterium]